jgi:2-C-methyl-D-erythritol 4-phosphate cytidylyltransferase
VANGFDHVADRADLVIVHDAARPFVSEALIAARSTAAVSRARRSRSLPVGTP